MQIINLDIAAETAQMLDGFDCPAILVSTDYRIMAANDQYIETFGSIDLTKTSSPHCYEVSHGFNKPCDQCGESCPLIASKKSNERERVLHIHNTPRGKEYVDVELLPIHANDGSLTYFIELLRTVKHASPQQDDDIMVGVSKAFSKVVDMINRVGPSNASVLFYGESGTGKELAAKALHDASTRKDNPFVIVECSGLSETLFESELFGHVKGAFTGASYQKGGLIEASNGGTLFLDEVGDIPLELQVKLLRLIESGTYRPVGSSQEKFADFRLVCATHKNLKQLVKQGDFRQDLFYRINVFPIYLPALRERKEDIPLLAKSILHRMSCHFELGKSSQKWLMQYDFDGNIRELRNILERACLLEHSTEITANTLDLAIEAERPMMGREIPLDIKSVERNYINQLMEEMHSDKKAVAQRLGISERTLYRKLQSN